MKPDPELSVGPADAADICDEVYADREEAVAIARQLRAAGWVVSFIDAVSPLRSGRVRTAAVVYHPRTYESPGEIAYADPG